MSSLRNISRITHGTWKALTAAEKVLGLVSAEGYSAEEALEEVRDDGERNRLTAYNTLGPQGKADALATDSAMTELGLDMARDLLAQGAPVAALTDISTARKTAERRLLETGRAVDQEDPAPGMHNAC